MILIADSGGSKTDWAIINNENIIFETSTGGMHPSVIGKKVSSLNVFNKYLDSIKEVYFYGTGCYHKKQQQVIKKVLEVKFNNAKINVLSDLMVGVHVGLCRNTGHIGIIGTGSSMAYFNGKNLKLITNTEINTAGDLGSAVRLMHSLEIERRDFKNIKTKTKAEKIRKCLSFLKNEIDINNNSTIVEREFKIFFEFYRMKIKTDKNKIVFIGGVANLFKDVLLKIANEFDFNIIKIIDRPINELKTYYSKLSKN